MANLTRVALSFLSIVPVCAGCSSKPGGGGEQGSATSCVGAAPAAGLGQYDSTLIAELQTSALVFRGTVTAVPASTSASVAVEAIAYSAPEVASLPSWGNSLTVDLTAPAPAVGSSVVFVTTLEEYNGGKLTVAELDRIDTAKYPHFEQDVPRMMQLFAANPLYARIASSTQIVVGTVDSVTSANAVCGSEHCPAWEIADVAVDDVLCGPDVTSRAPVDAGFASSVDELWTTAPKLTTGQQGVLLLHHEAAGVAFSSGTPDQIVIAALDVHSLADQAAIEALLASPPALP